MSSIVTVTKKADQHLSKIITEGNVKGDVENEMEQDIKCLPRNLARIYKLIIDTNKLISPSQSYLMK